ncbi:acyl-homoserine-lactone synthase TraI [Sinorhizobium medicae]|uniref:acyl-homoserine-lactone synthase n=1 Tax=Sinorhizobium medicae TaxID=110321 RepID=UPI001297FFE1|nr:acyl-homoserine-lactone synthase TraI [Sinorhizobium medicae]MQX75928.1 autoinducer synthesis protein [Sinorhizobium medicae]
MRILTVSPDLYGRHPSFLKQMYRLRASVFGGRLEWDVSVTAGEERNRYDDFKPTYVLAVNERGMVAGCARLLPASGPTMLEYIFPELLEKGSLNPLPVMVESSRFCVDTSQTAGREGGQLHLVTRTLFAGIIEWSKGNGYSEIVTATDLRFERILKRAGWPMRRLGEPAAIGDTMGSLPADRERFEQACPPGYRSMISHNHGAPIRSAA